MEFSRGLCFVYISIIYFTYYALSFHSHHISVHLRPRAKCVKICMSENVYVYSRYRVYIDPCITSFIVRV